MIQVKLTIVDESGRTIEVETEYSGELIDKNLDEIESLISQVKMDTMSKSESKLLEMNALSYSEKKKEEDS